MSGCVLLSHTVTSRLQAAEAGDCSGDTPPTGPWRATNGERTLDALMGDSRAAARRGDLPRADDLDRIAYDWSVEQGRRNSMGHNPNLGSQACCYRTVAENVGYYRTGGSAIAPADVDAIVRSIHDQWMGSSGHRANILDTRWHDVGFGVHVQGSALWVTAVYRERNDR